MTGMNAPSIAPTVRPVLVLKAIAGGPPWQAVIEGLPGQQFAAIAQSGTGDTIRVAPGIYPEQLTLGGGRSLRATGTAASTVIDSGSSPTIDVPTPAGSVEGFTIRGSGADPTGVLRVQANATVRGNVFDADDDGGPPTGRPVDIRITGDSAVVAENSFVDDGAGNQIAISSGSTGSPVVRDNRISGFFVGIEARGGAPEIRDNVITATHNSPILSSGTSIGVFDDPSVNTSAAITANYLHSPVDNGSGLPDGIELIDPVTGPGSTTVAAALRRNRVVGGAFGINIFGTFPTSSLDSDLVAGTSIFGMRASETAAGTGDVTATNVTFWNNAFDVQIAGTQLNLNSGILQDPISATGTAPGCAISFSRLSATPTSVATCDDALTNDTPSFVDEAGGDFHLLGFPSNPVLFGGGDPAHPPAGSRDFDGDLRELPANGTTAPTREIGADEILPGSYSPADTSITAGPTAGGVANGTPSFEFASTSPNSTFECALDDRAFSACTSPKSYAGLAAGSHAFAVRTIDPALQGNTDRTPATRSFTVDASPPDTQIADGPAAGSVGDGTPTFAFSSEAGASFECSIDRAPFAACSSTFEPSGLSDGEHRLTVRAVDAVGNADPTASTRTWSVDGTAPETTIDSGPADGATIDSGAVAYGFSATEAAAFECAIDGGGFEACDSPRALDLGAGTHTFAVRATDAVGNTDGSPASRSVTVRSAGEGEDTDPPETTIRKVKVKGDHAKAKFTSDEPGSTFQCKLDKGKFRRCSSPRRLKNLDDGRHKFKVRAIDPAGNRDPSPAKKKFEVG